MFQESLLYTSIPLKRNVSARISLRGQRRLIWVDKLRRCHNVCFLAGRLIYYYRRLLHRYHRARGLVTYPVWSVITLYMWDWCNRFSSYIYCLFVDSLADFRSIMQIKYKLHIDLYMFVMPMNNIWYILMYFTCIMLMNNISYMFMFFTCIMIMNNIWYTLYIYVFHVYIYHVNEQLMLPVGCSTRLSCK